MAPKLVPGVGMSDILGYRIAEVSHVMAAIKSRRHPASTEAALQGSIFVALDFMFCDPEREVCLNVADRIDFLVGNVGVEVKVKGAVGEVTRQLFRYAKSDRISSLLLVTTCQKHKVLDQGVANGKPIRVLYLGRPI